MNVNSERQPQWQPINNLGGVAGFITPATIQTNLSKQDFELISYAAAQILENPLEVRYLADRVYQLLKTDLTLQNDRLSRY